MANAIDPELKRQVEEDAAVRTDWERQRIDYYRSLRYDYRVAAVDCWLDSIYDDKKAEYKPEKNPSWNQIRKHAGIGFFEDIFSIVSSDKKKTLRTRKESSRRALQSDVDAANAAKREWCNRHNSQLQQMLNKKLEALLSHDPGTVRDYFSYALNQDSYLLDGEPYPIDFRISYIPENRRLIVEYKLPTMEQVPKVKEWKVGKDSELKPKEMNRTDYLEMYERILFDLAIRTVGILFDSDNKNTLTEIIFNGSCVYSSWQKIPTTLLSFFMPKDQFSYDQIRRQDYVSKREIAKLEKVAYLDDIHGAKAPADLWEEPPSKLVVPIQSNF